MLVFYVYCRVIPDVLSLMFFHVPPLGFLIDLTCLDLTCKLLQLLRGLRLYCDVSGSPTVSDTAFINQTAGVKLCVCVCVFSHSSGAV